MKLSKIFPRIVWCLMLTTVLVARATPVKFDLPAQTAAVTLVAFAKQAGVEVLFSFDELKKIQAHAVVGSFEPEEALERLLRGTGYTAQRNAAGKFVVTRDARPRRAAEIRGSVLNAGSGAPVDGAIVRLADELRGTRTGADGGFLLRDVPIETVALVVSAEGFVNVRVPGLALQAGCRTELGAVRLTPAGDSAEQLAEIVVDASDLGSVFGAPALYSLRAMVVTPSRYGLDLERGTIAATLTESDLLALPQLGDDLYRAISHLPGLAADDFTARFWVRGAPHEQVLARLDGLELVEPFHLKDFDSSISILDLETISSLNLYTGGFTADYGDRLAGVLAMETDSYARAKPRTTLGLSLTGARAASRGQTADGRGRWLVSARTGYPDLALKETDNGDSNAKNREIRPRYHDLMGKWEWQLTPNQQVSFHALHAGDTMLFKDSNDPTLTSRYGSNYAWMRWQGNFGGVTGEGALSYTDVTWRRDGAGLLDQQFPIEVHDRRSFSTVGLRQDWTASVSERALLRGGFEVKSGEADYNYHGLRDRPVLRNGVIQIERIARDGRAEPDGRTGGAYLALRFQPAAALTLEPGLRYDGNDYAHDSDVSPRFNAALRLGTTTVRAAWGMYDQARALYRLQVSDGETAFRHSERAEHRVLSVEHRLAAGINLRAEGYERIVRQPRPHWENVLGGIDAIAEVESDRFRIDPVRMQARGIELIAEQRSGRQVAWSASYAFARSDETLAGGGTIPRARDQRHTVYLDATYTPNPRWQFSAAWQYHTGWPTTEVNFSRVPLAGGGTVIVSNINALYGLSLPAYQRIDLRAQRRFQLKHSTLRVYLDIFNAFDRDNTMNYAYNLSNGPNGQLVTRRTSGDMLFPRLPSVGLTWDF